MTVHKNTETLCGWIRDQAALHGLLETLYALHLPILEVKHIPNLPNGGPAERGGNK